jgi:hypothetical protein
MAFSRHVYPELDFIFTQCVGVVDDNNLRIHLLSFEMDARGMKTIKELADIRGIKKADNATVRGLIDMADLDRKQSVGREECLAIVATMPLIHEMARMYTDLLKDSKNETSIFSNVDDALSWLGYNSQDVNVLRKFMNKHRV